MIRQSKYRHLILQITGAGAILLLWYLASMKFPPLVVPKISQVLAKLGEIATVDSTPGIILTTVGRLFCGLFIGVTIGTILGLLCGKFSAIDDLFTPLLSVFQSVPPISWLVLALVWFGFNGKPTIFIVATASVPTMTINLRNGMLNVSEPLLQMAKLYNFSRRKTVKHIVLPSVRPYFYSGLEVVIGNGWKLCVMGEVLTTTTGIGGMIVKARQNIESDSIIAWSAILVLFCWISQKLVKLFLHRKGGSYAGDTGSV